MKRILFAVMCFFMASAAYAQVTQITSFSPLKGPAGTTVTIAGSNFNPEATENIVFFGDVRATVLSASVTQLTVKVPSCASYKLISVLNKATALTAYSTNRFVVTYFHPKPFAKFNNFTNLLNPDYILKLAGNKWPVVQSTDFNNDGKTDLLLRCEANKRFSIIQNTIGGATYGTKIDFDIPYDINKLGIADFNGDGLPDIVVTSYSQQLIIFENVSGGGAITKQSFKPYVAVEFYPGETIDDSTIADINGDGKPDLLLHSQENLVLNFLNTSTAGTISFKRYNLMLTGKILAVGDIDGDNKPDIAAIINNGNSVRVYRNQSTTDVLEFDWRLDFDKRAFTGAIVDLNNDGKNELVFSASGNTYVCSNKSTLNNLSFYDPRPLLNPGILDDIGDLNGDGKPDLLLSNGRICYNQFETGAPADSSSFYYIAFPHVGLMNAYGIGGRGTLIDMDGDGKLDLLMLGVTVLMGPTEPRIFFYRNNPYNGLPYLKSFSPASGPVGTTVTITGGNFAQAPADNAVDFGGVRAEVVSVSQTELKVIVPAGAAYKPISVTNLKNKLTGYSTLAFKVAFGAHLTFQGHYKFEFATGKTPNAIAIGDLNGDGKQDVIVTNNGSGNISVYKNVATAGVITEQSLAPKVDISTGDRPWGVAIADMNGDGKPDIIVSNYGSRNFSILVNNSNDAAFSFSKTDYPVTTTAAPRDINVTDINADGRPDVILVMDEGRSYHIHAYTNHSKNGVLNTETFPEYDGFIGFTNHYNIPQFAVADFNGDDRPDIVSSNDPYRNIKVAGGPTEIRPVEFTEINTGGITGYDPEGMAAGDLDGDGWNDLVIADKNDNAVYVYGNQPQQYGGFNFKPAIVLPAHRGPAAVTIGDLTGDGKPEILVANTANSSICGYFNNSTPGNINSSSFPYRMNYATGGSPIAVNITDIDGDGKNDLIVLNQAQEKFIIIRNMTGESGPLAANTFTPEVSVNLYPNPTTNDIGFALENYAGKTITTRLTTLNGKLVNAQSFNIQGENSLIKLNLTQKPQAGIYLLNIEGEGLKVSKKVIVQ